MKSKNTNQEFKRLLESYMPIIIEKVKDALQYESVSNLMTRAELAKEFKVSKPTITNWINQKRIEPKFKNPAGIEKFDPRDFNQLNGKLFQKAYDACKL